MQLPQQKITAGFRSLVGMVRPSRMPETNVSLDALRMGMIELLSTEVGAQFTQTMRDLRLARSREELWHLRATLMGVLSRHYGEAKARESLGRIDTLFGSAFTTRRSRPPN